LTLQDSQDHTLSVLVVDEYSESLEILRTILELRGVNVLEARAAETGLEVMRAEHPRVVVLDLEDASNDDETIQSAFEDETRRCESSLVILGKARLKANSSGQVINKPYQYGQLIRTIERLLER
jgi:DNA-binding NtrC family response regulator